MGKTHRKHDDSAKDHNKSISDSNKDARRSHISRTASKLLRHQAENEKIPIDSHGWVRLDRLLAWKGFSQPVKFAAVSLEEIFDVVQHDGIHGKGRFGLKVNHARSNEVPRDEEKVDDAIVDEAAEVEASPNVAGNDTLDLVRKTEQLHLTNNDSVTLSETKSKNTAETLATIAYFDCHPESSPSEYSIRATQGHSIKSVSSEGLLIPVTLNIPTEEFPQTVVHGTFYASWPLILRSGGLKAMGRNMVHFGTGPPLEEVLPADESGKGVKLQNKSQMDALLSKNKVISGMRWDAQILIYIDLRRCLKDIEDRKLDMKWFRSGNGVILTERVQSSIPTTEDDAENTPSVVEVQEKNHEDNDQEQNTTPSHESVDEDGAAAIDKALRRGRAANTKSAFDRKKATQQQRHQKQPQQTPLHPKIVPTEYWIAAVEIKAGLGMIWKQGEGLIKELPDSLKNKSLPFGKQGILTRAKADDRKQDRDRKRNGNDSKSKPKLMVERGEEGDEEL